MSKLLLKIAAVAFVTVALSTKIETGKFAAIWNEKGPEFEFKKWGEILAQEIGGLVDDIKNQPPIVLGVKVSNESIATVADTLQNLPPQQLEQIKKLICQPEKTNEDKSTIQEPREGKTR